MSPRSILKRSSTGTPSSSSSQTASTAHAVHFPPSPSLCRTFAAHPPTIYDRTPIVVSKNNCALPERGCPGRTYVLTEEEAELDRRNGRSRHPNAAARSSYRGLNVNTHSNVYRPVDLPQLVPDLSSESDESDGFTSSPHLPQAMYAYGRHGLPTKYDSKASGYDYSPSSSFSESTDINALAFLPYPPSPPAHYHCAADPSQASKPRKKRSESRSRSNGDMDSRIRSDEADRASRRQQYLASLSSGFGARDDGCLGGF